MHTVTNPTRSPIYAMGITGADGKMRNFEIQSGDTVEADERSAMILGEYGGLVVREKLDEALLDNLDPKVEPVVSPWSDHGPGTTERGHTVDDDAAEAFEKSVKGDTSKTARQAAGLASSTGAIAVPTVELDGAETVSSGGTESSGSTKSDSSSSEDGTLKGAALEQALSERGLPSTGTADEKRAAVAAYDEEQSRTS